MFVEYHKRGRMERHMSKIKGLRVGEMNMQAAEAFWRFFEQEQMHFVEVLAGKDSEAHQRLIDEIDQMLCPVFPYAKPEWIGFQIGSGYGAHELILCHSGQTPLAQDMYRLCEMMPESLWKIWTVSLRV